MSEVQCPFGLCRQYVHILPTTPHPLIEQHDMPDVGTGIVRPCPASLMKYPPRASEIRALVEQAESLGPRTRLAYEQGVQERIRKLGTTTPPAESQSLRHPHRLGREPDSDSPDWYLGGRESEELAPLPKQQANAGDPPGYSLGRGPQMASITELANLVNAASAAGAEGRQALEAAQEALQRARAACAELLGEASSTTVEAMRTHYSMAIDDVEAGITHIDIAHDQAQSYIAALHS